MVEISDIKFKPSPIDISEDLLHFEKHEIIRKYKFGVLYVKEGQSEDDIYSNSTNERNTNTNAKNFLFFFF